MAITDLSLDIPFVKLKFCAKFVEEAILPTEKVSMLRGGMGEMMLLSVTGQTRATIK